MIVLLCKGSDGQRRGFVSLGVPFAFSRLALLGIGLLVSSAYPTLAIDCSNKSDAMTVQICADGQLADAYEKMELAYQSLLKKAPDDEIRKMLTLSQERWRQALSLAVDMVTDGSETPAGEEAEESEEGLDQRSPYGIVLRNIQGRGDDLSALEQDGVPTLIARALRQQHFARKFSGGDFAGFDTTCNYLPPDYNYYSCFTTQHFQNGQRICSDEEYWATFSAYENRFVANIVAGKPTLVASCTFNGNDTSCLGDGAAGNFWNLHPKPRKDLYSHKPLPKLDAEVEIADETWLNACLTEPSYPPPTTTSTQARQRPDGG